jgi:hypothetical protein
MLWFDGSLNGEGFVKSIITNGDFYKVILEQYPGPKIKFRFFEESLFRLGCGPLAQKNPSFTFQI